MHRTADRFLDRSPASLPARSRPFAPAARARLGCIGLLVALAVSGGAQETPAPAPAPVPESDAPPTDPKAPKAPRKRAGEADEPGQERPNKQGKQGRKRNKPDQAGEEKKVEPPPPQRVVDNTALGASLATLHFFDAAATADGRRTQFDAIEPGVAFEVWLEGYAPRPFSREEPDPSQPGQMRTVTGANVSVLKVQDAEFDEYWNYLMRLVPPGDEAMFITVVLNEMIEQKSMMLQYRDDLPEVEKRATAALAKLKAGAPMREVVQAHSEDDTSRSVDGLTLEDERGPLLYLYPFPKVLFELEKGDIVGPIYNKQAAYILMVDKITRSANAPWHDLYRASSVTLRYPSGKNLNSQAIATIKSSVRVRTAQDRFRRVLPPGLQVPRPAGFGPDDVAPLGDPRAVLKRRNIADAKDQPPASGG